MEASPLGGVDKALLALDALAGFGAAGAPLAALARTLGVSKPTLHRTLAALRHRGYAEQTPDGAYRLGPAALALGSTYLAEENLPALLHPALTALSEKVDELVHLGVLAGREVVYLDKVEPQRAVRVWSAVGRRRPAATTALGRALLSVQELDDEALERFARSGGVGAGATAGSSGAGFGGADAAAGSRGADTPAGSRGPGSRGANTPAGSGVAGSRGADTPAGSGRPGSRGADAAAGSRGAGSRGADTPAGSGVAGDEPVRRLREVLAEARRTGVARETEENEPGIACVAVPLLRAGRAVAAVSITAPVERLRGAARTERVDALRELLPTLLPPGLTVPPAARSRAG